MREYDPFLKKLTELYLQFEKEESSKRIWVLVGPPSVGKSTWLKKTFGDKKPYVISRDDLVEKVSEANGMTYDDMFASPPEGSQEGDTDEKYGTVVKSPAFMKWQPLSFDKVLNLNHQVQKLFTQRVQSASMQGEDIVVDMTNMNAGARKGALKAIEGKEENYKKIAVVFNFKGGEEIIKKMAAKRAETAKRMGKSKTIPPQAFDRMFSSFEEVKPEEGFDEIVSVDNLESLKKSLDSEEELNEDIPFGDSPDEDFPGKKQTVVFSKDDSYGEEEGNTHGKGSHAVKHLVEFEKEFVENVLQEMQNIINELPEVYILDKSNNIVAQGDDAKKAINSNNMLNTLDFVNDKFKNNKELNDSEKRILTILKKFTEKYDSVIQNFTSSAKKPEEYSGPKDVVKFVGIWNGNKFIYYYQPLTSALTAFDPDSKKYLTIFKIDKSENPNPEKVKKYFQRIEIKDENVNRILGKETQSDMEVVSEKKRLNEGWNFFEFG